MTRGFPDRWLPRFHCNERDVLEAFRATAAGIRTLLSTAETELNQQNAAYLASRLFEQRELIRQVMTRKNWKHARRLMWIHCRQRRKFLQMAHRHGLDAQSLATHCRVHMASLLKM